MALTLLCGFEDLSQTIAGTGGSFQSSVKRSGTYAFRANPSSVPGVTVSFSHRSAGGTSALLFSSIAFALRIDSLPTSRSNLYLAGGNADRLEINTDGTLRISSGGASIETSTSALSADSAWHIITFDVGWSAGSGRRVYVDGVEWASSSATAATAQNSATVGLQSAFNISADVYFDDCRCYDSSTGGAVNLGNQILLLPTGDPADRLGWTNGGGGTTSIFEGVNNIPPVGVAASTDGTKIKHAATGTNRDYVATMQTYTDAGVPAGATVNAVMALCNDGEAVSTGTKAGGIWIASNPAQTAGGSSFDFGNDTATVIGTFPTGWVTHYGPVTSAPSVTLGTAPTVTVRKNGSTSREVAVDFLGLYVDYTPKVVVKPTMTGQAVRRAALY